MKVIVTNDGNIPSHFAHSFNVMKVTQAFAQLGHKVELVTLLSVPLIRNKLKIKDIFAHYGISDRFPIKQIPVFNTGFLRHTIGVKGYNKKAADYIARRKPDFVYCRSYLTAVECIKQKIPCIVETHTTLYRHPDLQKLFALAHDRNFLGVVTISDILKDAYHDHGVPKEKIIVLDDGVDTSRFQIDDDRNLWREKLGLPLDKKILLYTGGLYKEKGIESILKTHQYLDRSDILTVFCGRDASAGKRWQSYSQEKNITGVLFKGFIPNATLPAYMKAADVLMMPYDTTVNYKVMDLNTTSPLKLFEYMASGRPIISSAIPVVERVVQNGEEALLAKENDIADQAHLVALLLGSPDLAASVAAKAKQKAQQYDWVERNKYAIQTLVQPVLENIAADHA